VSTYNRVVAADSTASLAPTVRARLATEMADPTSEVGTALASTFAPRPITNSTALRLWHTKLARRTQEPVKVMFAGHSLAEGTGATTYDQRISVVLNANLRARYALAGSKYGYITRSYISPAPTGLPYTTSGTVVGAQFGLGTRAWQIGAEASVSITFTGDRFLLTYTRAGGSGIMGIQIDGGAVTLVDTNNAAAAAQALWDSGAITAGAHTVIITRDATSTNDVYLCALIPYSGDYNTGIRVYDAGHHGAFITQAVRTQEVTQLLPFGLIVQHWGENDTAMTKNAYKVAYEARLTSYRSTGFTGAFLLLHSPLPTGFNATVWDGFRDAEAEIADAASDVMVLDLSDYMPAAGGTLGVHYDSKHFSSLGQAWEADILMRALMP